MIQNLTDHKQLRNIFVPFPTSYSINAFCCIPVWNPVVSQLQSHSTAPGWRQREHSRAPQPSGSKRVPPCTCQAACTPLPADSRCHLLPCSVPWLGRLLPHPEPASGESKNFSSTDSLMMFILLNYYMTFWGWTHSNYKFCRWWYYHYYWRQGSSISKVST